MRVTEVTKDIYFNQLPAFFKAFKRPLTPDAGRWRVVEWTLRRNFYRWFVAVDPATKMIVGFAVVCRCHRPNADKNDKRDLHYRISDFLILPAYQQTKAARQLFNKIMNVAIAENATYISIDCDPNDLPFFQEMGFTPRTDAVSLTRMLPWLEYEKPPVFPETTVLHNSNCTSAAEPSESQAS